MFWKFPESVKCARLRLAHLTNSGNFQNINTPAEPLPGHPALEIKAMSELSALGEASKKDRFFCIFCKSHTYSHPLLPTLGSDELENHFFRK